MLSEEIKEKLVNRLTTRIDKANEYLLKELGKIIKDIKEGKKIRYIESYYKVINKISKVTETNIKDIYNILDTIGKDVKNDSKVFYKYKNIDFVPYNEDNQSKQIVNNISNEVSRDYANNMKLQNLGIILKGNNNKVKYQTISQTYENVIEKATNISNMEEEEYYKEMQDITEQIGKSSIKTIDYSKRRSIALTTVTGIIVMNGIRQATNTLQERYGNEFGANGIEILPHSHPAPDHAPLQGKQYTFEEFEDLQGSLDRPIGEYNCYHDVRRIIVGVTKPEYNKKELKQILQNNEDGFEIDNKHYTTYQGTQMQRELERRIKEEKNVQIIGKASGDKETVQKAQSKIIELTNKYKELSNKSGLKTKMERMRVSGYRRIDVNKM